VALDEDMAEVLDGQSGVLKTGGGNRASASGGVIYSERAAGPAREFAPNEGGASRFFYVAKAPKRERPVVDGAAHPTVKPLALMRWLIRLVTPEGGVVLDPFAGSGTTLEAAALEGFQSIGIEREAEYLPLIQARIERAA
jgi:site-specific DNA-methyltransferase (adenine-specific)